MRRLTAPALGVASLLVLLVTATGGAAPPTSKVQAKVVVYNLIENNRPQCPILKWRFAKVAQSTFRGIKHPGRGKLLWKVTTEVQWAGLMFKHLVSWTVVGKKALPADMNPLPSVVYRDEEAAWIGKGCPGCPPFGQC